MVYHYRTVKCPNCRRVADRTRTVDSQQLKGSPFRVCRHCGTVYFDSEYKEEAILIFKDKGGNPNFWSYLWLILSNAFAIFFLVGGAKEGFRGLNSSIWFALFVFLGLAVLIDVGFIRVIRNRIHANEYHQKSLDKLEGRAGELTGELAASMERMSNKAYLDALKAHGVVVPSYFYERLHGKGEANFSIPNEIVEIDSSAIQLSSEEVEDNSEAAIGKDKLLDKEQDTTNEAAFCRKCGAKIPADSVFCPKCGVKVVSSYDEIMKAQERYKFGKTMLSYGKRDKQVKEKAAQANMDTDEFLKLCKKWVSEYDELHRQYNSTHYPPIDYPN